MSPEERDLLPPEAQSDTTRALLSTKGSLDDPRVVETLRWLIANKDKDANHFAAYCAEVVRLGPELLERAQGWQTVEPLVDIARRALRFTDSTVMIRGWGKDWKGGYVFNRPELAAIDAAAPPQEQEKT